MSVLTTMERKTLKGRMFLGLVFLALLVGGVTMVYPFLVMLSGATRSEMDASDMSLVPAFFYDDTELARKFLERKYNYDVATMNRHRGSRELSFAKAFIPPLNKPKQLEDFTAFLNADAIPDHWQIVGGTVVYRRTTQPNQRRLVELLYDRFDGDLNAYSQAVGNVIPSWRFISFTPPNWSSRRFNWEDNELFEAYFELMRESPLAERAPVSLSAVFKENVIFPRYGRYDVDDYNAAHARPIESYAQVQLPARVPGEDQPTLREEWLFFVYEVLNGSFVRTDVDDQVYQAFLRTQYDSIEDLNRIWRGSNYASFDQITLPSGDEWVHAAERIDFQAFIQTIAPESLYLVGPEFTWRSWLQQRYASIEALNASHGTSYADWSQVAPPVGELENQYVLEHAGSLRMEFIASNFIDVFNEILLQGRPLFNTVVYVLLALFFSLTLQPLAAYALSRFDPPFSWQLILIFMATMAFPPMVGMIPQFLILRQFDLLNTFAALVLPVMVNGYLIFLLKGFFDSLPQHLYEAAMIDGASELRMFGQITMALSKPILAVVALNTFNLAWMSFLYPLLVAPEQHMHVLAVWLYQYQMEAPTPAVFASIMITSIPTLLIFVFTQRTIMRGIAVPAEK